ncbi:MAG TPA: penicillin-binding protein 2 [Solirubrobacterales bacterium]|jgi:cell division protein FtsI/penicillin-binding protein 2|nr:penicillin-binding protein 2 [Solirubrobacterales bacterium]
MRLIERRIGLLFAGFLVAFLLIVCRAFWLQGVEASQLSSQALDQQTQTVAVPGLRGSILDRDGTRLASSEDAATIYATPYQVKNPPRAAGRLAPILKQRKGEVLEELTAESGFSYLAKDVDLATAAKVEKFEIEGIGQLPASRRAYPQGEMAGQVIGVVGSEGQGLTGIEAGEQSVLAGEEGERRVVTDALGDPIKLETVKEARDGEDVQLTLDPVIQEKAEQVLAKVGETYSPQGATAIVMDPETSEILAMANWPPVNPGDLEHASDEDLQNRATSFNYEPGSTFKAFTVSAALEEGLVTPSTEFVLPPALEVGERVIHDAEERGTETMTVEQILARSSNIGAVTIGLEVGATKFSKWIEKFGFGKPTGVQFPGEEQGIVPKLGEYSGATMGNLPMGQGAAVTPMQMVQGYAAIAHGGVERPPQLVRQVGEEAIHEPKGHRVISAKTAQEVREMLEGVLGPEGTASELSVPGYTLAGKTGTAQVAEDGGYSEYKYVASFIGFAPALHPKFLAAVIVDQPAGEIYGGSVAAPAFGELAAFSLPYLGVPQE